jgi:hypothetical protein
MTFDVMVNADRRASSSATPFLVLNDNAATAFSSVADQLASNSDELTRYRVTGEQFADEMIAEPCHRRSLQEHETLRFGGIGPSPHFRGGMCAVIAWPPMPPL